MGHRIGYGRRLSRYVIVYHQCRLQALQSSGLVRPAYFGRHRLLPPGHRLPSVFLLHAWHGQLPFSGAVISRLQYIDCTGLRYHLNTTPRFMPFRLVI